MQRHCNVYCCTSEVPLNSLALATDKLPLINTVWHTCRSHRGNDLVKACRYYVTRRWLMILHWGLDVAWFRYNTSDFLLNAHIMGVFLSSIDNLYSSPSAFMWYVRHRFILNRVITRPDCTKCCRYIAWFFGIKRSVEERRMDIDCALRGWLWCPNFSARLLHTISCYVDQWYIG